MKTKMCDKWGCASKANMNYIDVGPETSYVLCAKHADQFADHHDNGTLLVVEHDDTRRGVKRTLWSDGPGAFTIKPAHRRQGTK